MRKLFRTKMSPLLLIMAFIASAIDSGFIQPNVVYAAEESTALQQGTQAMSSIVLGKGTIEIDGHLFTDEDFQTFLSNAKIYRVPFEQSSTFALGDYVGIVGEDAQAAGGNYKNGDGQLPLKDSDGNEISYREWDVNNKQPESDGITSVCKNTIAERGRSI